MNIYALRDRLIDYYMRAFSDHDDKNVMAAIAASINEGDPNSALAKAPHHFEIWRLGKITEEGDIRPGKELLCTCDSLVRTGVRNDAGEIRGTPATGETPDRSSGAPQGIRSRHAAYNGALPHPARSEDQPGAETPTAAPGSPESR